MLLHADAYGRLPGIGRAIVDVDRRIDEAMVATVIPLAEARRIRDMIVERDDLVRSADKIYGRTVEGDGGTNRS